MMHETHSQLGINATAEQQQLTQNDLVDALDNLANAAKSKNNMVKTKYQLLKHNISQLNAQLPKIAQINKIIDKPKPIN